MKDFKSIVKPDIMFGIPDIGDVLTKEEFMDCVETRSLTDYNGTGEFATIDQASGIGVIPSYVNLNNTDNWPVWATHVVWYKV